MKTKYFIDYNKAADACCVEWVSDEYQLEELTPYIEAILCDDGEEYVELYCDEFEEVQIDNFAALPGDDPDTYLLCYTAVVAIDLEASAEFEQALEVSDGMVEVKIGFKDSSGEEIDDDLYEGHTDLTTELLELED